MKQVTLLIIITLFAFVIRFYNITASPAGLYIDETSIGYNAYSLLETGKDEHGQSWPLFFEAFGEWKLPVYVYAVFLAQLILGPTDVSVRLPAVLFGTASVVVVYFLVKELLGMTYRKNFFDPQLDRDSNASVHASHRPSSNAICKNSSCFVALLAAFLLAISPWHFQFTHAGFEASAGLFFLVVGVWLFLKGTQYSLSERSESKGIQKQGSLRQAQAIILLVVSLVSFVLTLYSYNSARIVTPVLVIALFILYLRSFSWKQWVLAGSIGVVLSVPFLLFAFSPAGLVRAQQVSIFADPAIENPYVTFVKNYWKNSSPENLFIEGDPTIAHTTPHRMSLLHLIEFPFVVVGLVVLLKKLKLLKVVAVWIVVAFAPAAMTTLNPHALRAFFVVPALAIISAVGFGWVILRVSEAKREVTTIKEGSRRARTIMVAGFILYVGLLLFSTFRFLTIYHTKYTVDAGWDWQVDVRRASERVKELESEYDRVYFSEAGAARIAFAWYLKIPPEQFQKDKSEMGKYRFGVFEDGNFSLRSKSKDLYVVKDGLENGRLIDIIQYPNGSKAYEVWEK